MDRQIVYPGAIPLETDILSTNRYSMIGLAKLAKALLGANTTLFDFACSATSPASLAVNVGQGQIYSLQPVDATAYSSLPADTADQILKQGLNLSTVQLSCPAPTTAGYSINYLVEVGYEEVDGDAVVLPYYNASNPAQPYSGPNNSGSSQPTVRQGVASVQVKAGIPAATGSQTTPSADAGYVPAYVVTVAYGQTTVTGANISVAPTAPFLTAGFVASALTQAQGDARYGQLAVANTWTQPQNMPNATAATNPVTLAQADARYSPRNIAVSLGANGNPLPNQFLTIFPVPTGVTVTFPSNFATSAAACLTAPTAAITCNIATVASGSNTLNSVGSLTFGAGGLTGTFSTTGGNPVTVAGPAMIVVTAPSTSDATFANIGGTLYGSF